MLWSARSELHTHDLGNGSKIVSCIPNNLQNEIQGKVVVIARGFLCPGNDPWVQSLVEDTERNGLTPILLDLPGYDGKERKFNPKKYGEESLETILKIRELVDEIIFVGHSSGNYYKFGLLDDPKVIKMIMFASVWNLKAVWEYDPRVRRAIEMGIFRLYGVSVDFEEIVKEAGDDYFSKLPKIVSLVEANKCKLDARHNILDGIVPFESNQEIYDLLDNIPSFGSGNGGVNLGISSRKFHYLKPSDTSNLITDIH